MKRVFKWIRLSKQVKASNRSSVTVRIEDNTIGHPSTTDVDPAGVELALKTAYEASFFVKENIPDFSPEAFDNCRHP